MVVKMKRIFKNITLYIGILSTLVASSCKPEIEGFQTTPGEADFSKYISVGNSLTAGFADGDYILKDNRWHFLISLQSNYGKWAEVILGVRSFQKMNVTAQVTYGLKIL